MKEEYIINSAHAWGRGAYETKALMNLAANWHGDTDELVELHIVRVRGFQELHFDGTIYADEILEEELVTVDGEALGRLSDLLGEAELAAEDIFETATYPRDNEITTHSVN